VATPRDRKKNSSRPWSWALAVALWLLAAWLLYPLANLDKVDMSNVLAYLYRSAIGLTLLVIMFGKTLFDLIFPWIHDRRMPRLNAILLTVYALALSGGIIFVVLRVAMLYAKSRPSGTVF
jgi:uncharacterized membrane protein YhdT